MSSLADLEETLRSAEPELRRRALRRLSTVPPADAARLVLVALADDDWRVRKEAVLTVRDLGDRDALVAGLCAGLGDAEDVGLRNACVEALAHLGADAVQPTVAALGALDADGRKLAVEVLGGVADLRAVRALVAALDDADANVRCAAAEALGSAATSGEDARAAATHGLLGVLSREDAGGLLRLAALEALDRLEATAPAETLGAWLADPMLRRPALRMLSRAEGPGAIDAIARSVTDESAAVRRDAAQALATRLLAEKPDAGAAARAQATLRGADSTWLRSAARDRDDGALRASALVLLGVRGEELDLDVILEALDDPELEGRAEQALRIAGPGVMDGLLRRLPTAPPSSRASVLPVALAISEVPPPALLAIARHDLGEAAPEAVASAARVLGATGSGDDLARMAPLLAHDDARVAAAAEGAFLALAGASPARATALVASAGLDGPLAVAACLAATAVRDATFPRRALASGDVRVRRSAVDALAAIGDRSAIDDVALALADEERDVRLAAIRALGRLGSAESLATLAETAPDAETTGAALRALGDAEPQRAFDIARRMLSSSDAARACVAVEAVSRHTGPHREDALLAALDHSDAGVLTLAMTELAGAPTPRAVLRLGMALDHESWEVRHLAAELLGSVGDTSSEALLRARLDREPDPGVREALQEALSHRGGLAWPPERS